MGESPGTVFSTQSDLLPLDNYPDSKDHGANMGPTWVMSTPGVPHVGPMNLAIKVDMADKLDGTKSVCFFH